MAKYDEQLGRMEYLMNFRMPLKESTRSNVEYCAEAANGKCYGIIKEGNKYYIKECKDASRKTIAESYDYINGITAKKENEYKSYNEASKQFELKLMSINESRDNKVNASTYDFKRNEKVLATLTEEARKELNRMHAILENANAIGMKNTGNPEAPKTVSFTPSIGNPFEERAEAKLDKDLKATASDPKKVGGPFEENGEVSDADMESDKAPKCGNCCDGYKDAEYVPADAVAAKKPSGGKVVRVNEAEEDIVGIDDKMEDPILNDKELAELTASEDEEPISDVLTDDENMTDFEVSRELAGDGNEYSEFDAKGEVEDAEGENTEFDAEGGDTEFGVDDEFKTDYEFARDTFGESKISLKTIVEGVCHELFAKGYGKSEQQRLEESFAKKIDKLVAEEVHRLDVFGKHPGYRKAPMTTPANKEVIVNKGDRDWNDDSTKGEQPFGQKIGSSAPFDAEVIDMLTDAVMNSIKGGLKKK